MSYVRGYTPMASSYHRKKRWSVRILILSFPTIAVLAAMVLFALGSS